MTLIQDLAGVAHYITGWPLALIVAVKLLTGALTWIGSWTAFRWIGERTIARRHCKPAASTPPRSVQEQLREDHPERGVHYEVLCPCGTSIPVPIACHLEDRTDGSQELMTIPDMTDLWAHSFTHENEER